MVTRVRRRPERHLSSPSLTHATDAALLDHVRAGDDNAYGELYRRHVGAARAAARCLLRSRHDAEDVVAEAFARVLSIVQRGGGPEEAFRPYLMTCVRNASYDRVQRVSQDAAPIDPAATDQVGTADAEGRDPHEVIAEADVMGQAFASLPERWQLVLWSLEVDGRTPAEVGATLSLSPSAVAALAYRARNGLKEAYLAAHVPPATAPECAAMRPRLAALVRGSLAEPDREALEAHVRDCADCRALEAELRDLNRPLRDVLVPGVLGVSALAYARHLHPGLWSIATQVAVTQPAWMGAAAIVVAAGAVTTAAAAGVLPVPLRQDQPTVTTTTVAVEVADPAAPVVIGPGASTSAPTGGSDPAGTPTTTPGSDPNATDPTAPGVTVPGAPGVTVPGVPGVTVPGVPDVTVPGVPDVTVPGVTVPPVTVPGVPGVTVPEVTVPPVTVPPVTVPSVTVPSVTVPSVTVPSVTVPSVTVPAVTTPVVTTPAVTTPTVTTPAVTTPPVTTPPVTTPPVTVPPVTVPPVTVPPVTLP